jgi:hypothetical protein
MSYFHYHLVVELSATFQVVACVSSEYRPCIVPSMQGNPEEE